MRYEEVMKMRETSPNFPFSDGIIFCYKHTRESDVIDVVECKDCHMPERKEEQ